ncbi:hypothetical protein KAU34_07565 [candidate division WOR-3 bacterium]|nr:hypothetical protein [candidate division WOR-3 bacterium]
MADKIVNNSTDVPFEEHENFKEGEMNAGTDELDKLEPEEIAEILRKQNLPKETPSEEVLDKEEVPEAPEETEEEDNITDVLDALNEEETDTDTDDNESDEDSFALPDKLKGKTKEEIAKMYINAEKLGSTHTAELGELRKQKAELATAKELAKKYEIEMSANKVTPKVKKWTPEEVATFIRRLGEDPQNAFADLIKPYIKPLVETTALTRNERMEEKLITDNKDKVVPYDRAEVNKVLKAQPELWKEYGTKAIKIAFNIYKENAFEEKMTAKEKAFTEELNEKRLNKDKEQATHMIGGAPAGKKTVSGDMKKAINKISKMDPDKALAILDKILPRSDVKR